MGADEQAGRWDREVDLGAQTWVEIEKLARSRAIVVVPSGAIEVYGAHLPLASDSIVAEGAAHLVARRLDALCTPLVPVGSLGRRFRG